MQAPVAFAEGAKRHRAWRVALTRPTPPSLVYVSSQIDELTRSRFYLLETSWRCVCKFGQHHQHTSCVHRLVFDSTFADLIGKWDAARHRRTCRLCSSDFAGRAPCGRATGHD